MKVNLRKALGKKAGRNPLLRTFGKISFRTVAAILGLLFECLDTEFLFSFCSEKFLKHVPYFSDPRWNFL